MLKRKVRSLFWLGFSKIKYANHFFLDSNMVVSGESKSDGRVEKLHRYFSTYLLTDVVAKEVQELLDNGRNRIFLRRYGIVSFLKLREVFPSLCPVYYNLISWMYNPANIASQEFALHLLQSLKLRGRTLSSVHEKLYMRFMSRLKQESENNVSNLTGKPKTLLAKNMDISAFHYFRKKIKNRNSENLLNDYRNISSVLLFALTNKTNVVFATADRDLLAIIWTLAESLAQGITFHYFILPTLTDNEKHDILSGKKITRFLDFKKFKDYNEGVLGDILNPYWQKDHISFRVRLWDNNEKCFVEDMVVNFDNMGRELILNMHGPLSCPYAKNNTHGNWIHYQYWPPPLKSPNVIKVMLWGKKIINRKDIYVPDHIHQRTCRYAIDEKNGRLKEYYGFWL
ncbi:hypothetical protein KJ854_00955 [Patescibacteria group bacterium]|nr:hypothetical protein [Patescibacteria group bacterium]MBU4142244.1 hypothetical protein [Patescibacteria group bacterium]